MLFMRSDHFHHNYPFHANQQNILTHAIGHRELLWSVVNKWYFCFMLVNLMHVMSSTNANYFIKMLCFITFKTV